jgi:malate dehydrogenase
VIITAGLPRKPGMSRMDLLEVNAKIVKSVTEEIARHSPDAVLIVVTNPLDQMATLAAQVSGFPHNRVFGQAGILDSSRFAHFISEAAGVDIQSVEAYTFGSHGPTMVPVPSLCRVGDVPLAEALPADTIEALVERTRNGGAEIVGLLKTGSAYYAPSAAAACMAKAVIEDSGKNMPVCAWMTGEYGIEGVYLGVMVEVGAGGVRRVIESPITDEEKAALVAASEAVRVKVADLDDLDL